MSQILSLSIAATSASYVHAQDIVTRQQMETAADECGSDQVCLFQVLDAAIPLSDELIEGSMGLYFWGYQRQAAVAFHQAGTKDGLTILNSAIVQLERIYAKVEFDGVIGAMLHMYRAEACHELGLDDCFADSANRLLEREIEARRAYFGISPSLSRPYRWSEIREIRVSRSRYEDGFEDEIAPSFRAIDPKGTDFRDRIDQILTLAESGDF